MVKSTNTSPLRRLLLATFFGALVGLLLGIAIEMTRPDGETPMGPSSVQVTNRFGLPATMTVDGSGPAFVMLPIVGGFVGLFGMLIFITLRNE